MATSALTIPQWSTIVALVMTVSTAPRARGDLALAHAVANDLAAAELHLLAIGGEVLLDLDEEFGVGEPDPIAPGGAEHVGVGGAGEGGRREGVGALGHGGLVTVIGGRDGAEWLAGFEGVDIEGD